jgi:hypothetical protein
VLKEWRVVVVAAAMAVALGLPAAATADVTVSGLTVAPSTTAAGAHPDVTITENFTYSNTTDSVKNTTLHFPAGLIGNPRATATCSDADFTADTCPADTQVGKVSVGATAVFIIPITAPGTIYNLVPDASHPAALGIVVRPPIGDKIFLRSPISLRTSTDFGIDSPVDDQPNTALSLPLQITSTTLTLFGTPPGAAAPFMTNPTSCKPATTNFDAVSYETPGTTATKSDTFTPTDCDRLPFAPTITATMGAPGATAKGSHVPFAATVTQTIGEASQLSTAVTLPASLGPGPIDTASLCTVDQLAAAACPAGARIGTATIGSPLLPAPVQGPVFGVVRPGQLPGVGVEVGGTLPFVLSGATALAPGPRIQNVFTSLPDIPLTTFTLAIDGGPRGLLVSNRDICTGTTPTVIGAFTGQNGASASPSANVTVNGCGAARLTSPKVAAHLTGLRGRHPWLQVTVLKGPAAIRTLSIQLPSGLQVKKTHRGTKAVVAKKFKLSKRQIRLSRNGKLTLRLPSRGASRVTAQLGNGSIVGSKSVRAKLKKRRSLKLRLVIRTVDTQSHGTTLRKTVTGRR